MITIRKADQRGGADYGWLKTFHTFSFNHYYDEQWMGFHGLRVINEDFIAPATGFPTHPHRDMEILSYVVDGELSHRDSMGHEATIKPNIVQRISAGSGIQHSEYNKHPEKETHMLQIWIEPKGRGLEPRYSDRDFGVNGNLNELRLLASEDGRDGSLEIYRDSEMYDSWLQEGRTITFSAEGRPVWLQLIQGSLSVNGEALAAGDAAGIEDEKTLTIEASSDSQFLLFRLDPAA